MLNKEVYEAAKNCDIEREDVEEAYQGRFSSDEDFTKQLLEDLGEIPTDLPLYVHIDWEATAKAIMIDYCENNGYYFRIN